MSSTLERIRTAMFRALGQVPLGIPIIGPNMTPDGDATQQPPEYAYAEISPDRPRRVGISGPDTHIHSGRLVISLLTPLDDGETRALELVGILLTAFPADRRLAEGSTLVRCVQTPHAAGGYRDGARWRTPVMVYYETMAE